MGWGTPNCEAMGGTHPLVGVMGWGTPNCGAMGGAHPTVGMMGWDIPTFWEGLGDTSMDYGVMGYTCLLVSMMQQTNPLVER